MTDNGIRVVEEMPPPMPGPTVEELAEAKANAVRMKAARWQALYITELYRTLVQAGFTCEDAVRLTCSAVSAQ